jgi:hypothetical protein
MSVKRLGANAVSRYRLLSFAPPYTNAALASEHINTAIYGGAEVLTFSCNHSERPRMRAVRIKPGVPRQSRKPQEDQLDD